MPYRARETEFGDIDNELEPEKGADLKEEADNYEDWPPWAPSILPVAFTAGDATQMEIQVCKLEIEVKLQKLTNELQELKSASGTEKSNNSRLCQSLLERAVNQALREGQGTAEVVAFLRLR